MDVRSPFFQNIALIVAGVMFLNPIVASAAQLTVDAQAGGNTSIGQAGNGVPIVNIATPNGSGLSHNKFTDYNVGQQGLILNNGAQAFVPTQLGGYITGNPNLQGGAANVILNEVTGSNRSQLKGYTEVAGQAAHVIVANPHGITCDGCGFINTPRATLTTGAPVVENGRLQRFDVNGGDIAIEGAGLNAGNVDQFDLITRSAQINAEIHAKRLNVIAGRNEVDVATLQATAKADDGSQQPQLAIDSSALGGMYAGAIRLVGTEAGVGVKLAGDMAASAGDIQIDANGQLTTNRMAASNDVTLVAKGVELNADTYAGRNATVTATDKTVVKESLAAGSKVEVGGGELENQGIVEAGVKADGTLVTNSQLVLNSERVTNRGELIARGTLNATVDELDNRTGKLVSAGDATIQAAKLDNSQGQLIAQKNLTLKGGDVTNHAGEVVTAGRLHVDGAALDNQGGTLAANAIDMKLTGALTNDQGLIESTQSLKLDADSAQNHNGRLRALASTGQSDFQIGSLFDNGQGLVEIGNAAFSLSSGSLTNVGGTVRHLGSQGFDLSLDDLGGAGGRFTTNGELTLSAADWTNTSELQAERLTLNIGQFTQTATGQLISRQSIVATGDSWVNDGLIATDGTLGLTLTGSYTGNGALSSLGDLIFKAASAEFGTDAQVKSGGVGQFDLTGQLLNRGRLTAAQDMSLKLGSLDNRGTLGGAGLLRIEGDSLRNEQGLVFSGGDMTLRTTSLTNLLGDIYSLGGLDVARDEQGGNLDLLDNRSASIESAKDMTLRAAVLRNRKDVFDWGLVQTYGGVIKHCGDCGGDHHNVDYEAIERFEARVQADSAASRIHSGENLNVKAGEVTNQYSTLSAVNDISVVATSLENTGANLVSVERIRVFNTGRVTDGTEERFTAGYVYPYNAQPLPKTLPSAFYRWRLVSDIQRETPIGIAAPAIIQAGGNVDIRATQPITNAAVMAHSAPQAGGSTPTLETSVDGASAPLVVQLNPQLAADKAQQAIDPISLPGFSLPQGQNGLFQTNTNPGHRYLIETNPAFADLKNFLNSDYLLSRLGFDPDVAQKRLGDGLYEQRLIEQAVAARTGKRLLDGLTNNDAQFRYLMDNALASKDALSLSLGVGLSASQVAALTHDIVWLEEREVQGEKVLVPVLYLAQVGDRLAPTGALIQGQDVALISGSSLNNSGTLRASKNLSATASSIGNSGLMQADERLKLLANESIRNAQGGIIRGHDVSLTTVSGNITNERTISQQSMSGKGFSQLTSVVDKAASIEAGNTLQIKAGGDIQNIGGSLRAGGDAELKARGDVIIASAEEEHGSMRKDKRHFWSSTSTTQHGSDVQVGGNLAVSAGQDIAVVASTVKATGDVLLDADRDVIVAAAADESSSEYRYKRSGKKVNKENSTIRQQAAVIDAGGDLTIQAERNVALNASNLTAGGEAYLYAGEQLALLAAQNSDYSLYDMKKKGSWGSKKTQRDEVTTVRNVGTTITSGGDLTLVSEGDQLYQRARLESGADLTLESGGSITFEAVKDLDQESHEKSKSSLAWTSGKGKGKTDETVLQSQLIAEGNVTIRAVEGLKIDVKQVNQQSVSQAIDAMVKADPSLEWIKQAEQRGDVDWRQVKEIHDSFKYSHSGLGVGAQIIIAIAMAAIVGPMAAAAAGGGAGGAAAGAIAAGASTNAAVSTVNNRGNLGAVFKDVTSSDALKGYAVSGITAGVTAAWIDPTFGGNTNPANSMTHGFDLTTVGGVAGYAGHATAKAILQAGVGTAINGGSFSDNLSGALATQLQGVLQAVAFNAVGAVSKTQNWETGSPEKIVMHALVGGLLSEAAGGTFAAGALAAGANEALVKHLDSLVKYDDTLLTAASQIVGVVAAGAVSGEKDLQLGADIAGSATNYNYLGHEQLARAAREINSCKSEECVSKAQLKYLQISAEQDAKGFVDCASNAETCKAHSTEVANAKLKLDAIYNELGDGIDDLQKKEAIQALINQNNDVQEMLAMATTGRQAEGALIKIQTTLGLSDTQVADIKEAMLVASVGGPMGAAAFFKIKSILASSAAKKRAALNVASDNGSSKDINLSSGNPVPGPTSFMGSKDQFFKNASNRADVDPDGFFDVVAHGSQQKIEITTPSGTIMADQRLVSKLIENNAGYTGQPIRLLSCDTGACDTGFAQNLANKMGVPVKAPTSLVWAYSDGRLVVAPRLSLNKNSPLFNTPDLSKQGVFKIFNPGKPE
ncbi:DUF637 domain-containing protein [Pseudomonas sp. PA27(2017)]|uniref:two-partner secretion domain-containing protein n=1 Tax=Pseudomonas sp. PA27(2017) TaxID=1932112 RepID=UPI000969DADB|nr:DUF637 domain-containing protein [Pseudomonas sp. PA27(2017)]OLU29573.1 hypothetical protein BVH06_16185 [Pseudomonas sp. PA27(2017)]